MKISEQWLRQWVDPALSIEELAEHLTMAGIEVAAITPVAGVFTNVVVGSIVKAEPHPNADRLQVCQVDVGQSEVLTIVCGAKNARRGLKVAVAQVGAKLPELEIKAAKLRGVASFGMLCSEVELGLAERSDGIMELSPDAPIGQNLREHLHLDDMVLEIELTPNRGDCLSVHGLAREIAAIESCQLMMPKMATCKKTIPDQVTATILAPHKCARYLTRIIRNVRSNVSTPNWITERLRRSDINTISPIVDVTNYVMLELGQPMHAFDLAKISGGIVVRPADKNETIELLDGQSIALSETDLVIADSQKAIALAGIMGGNDSAVSDSTLNIMIEAAYFDAVGVALTARHHAIHTESSHRFERGVDPELANKAMERVTELLLEIVGGEAGPVKSVESPTNLPNQPTIELRPERVASLLGVELNQQTIQSILKRLAMQVKKVAAILKVTPPGYRFDISQEVDLIEEIARLYGYNNIPMTTMAASLTISQQSEQQLTPARVRSLLVDQGYHEVITYSFIDEKLQQLFSPNAAMIKLTNPISSDMAVMRSSIWPGLVQTLIYNLKRQQESLRIFETGLCFFSEDQGVGQQHMLAGLVYGSLYPEQWALKDRNVDFYDVKHDLVMLLQLANTDLNYEFKATNHPVLHPGQAATLIKQGQAIGFLGALHPKIAQQLHINKPVYLFELNLSLVYNALVPSFNAFSKYPSMKRDLAVLVKDEVTADSLLTEIRLADSKLLRNVQIFDIYRGEGIPKGEKSVALSLTFQDSARTLVDSEVDAVMQLVVKRLTTKLNATLRG